MQQVVTHQTVRLGRGKHRNPAHGACVMEVASMLAGESFSDRPRCVCRVIGAFVRGYNDLLDDDRRQDLYEYAAKVVGSAASAEIETARAQRLRQWGDELLEGRRWALVARLRRLFRRPGTGSTGEAAAHAALRALGRVRDDNHAAALAVIDELLALGRAELPTSIATDQRARTASRVTAVAPAERVRVAAPSDAGVP